MLEHIKQHQRYVHGRRGHRPTSDTGPPTVVTQPMVLGGGSTPITPTVLRDLIANGDEAGLTRVLDRGLDPNTIVPQLTNIDAAPPPSPATDRVSRAMGPLGSTSQTLLQMASDAEQERIVALLISCGADTNLIADVRYPTALQCACRWKRAQGPNGSTRISHGHKMVAKRLLQAAADPNLRCSNAMSALHLAVQNNHPELVKVLVDSSADVAIGVATHVRWVSCNRGTEVMDLLLTHDTLAILPTLLPQQLDVNTGRHALHYVVDRSTYDVHRCMETDPGLRDARQWALTRRLVAWGASVHARTKTGSTPLHIAWQWLQAHLCYRLVSDLHADVHVVDSEGRAPFEAAPSGQNAVSLCFTGECRFDEEQLSMETFVHFLLDHNVNAYVSDEHGDTAVHHYCRYRVDRPDILRRLLPVDSDEVNRKNKLQETPLLIAASHVQSRDLVQQLLRRRADPNTPCTNDGVTVLHALAKGPPFIGIGWIAADLVEAGCEYAGVDGTASPHWDPFTLLLEERRRGPQKHPTEDPAAARWARERERLHFEAYLRGEVRLPSRYLEDHDAEGRTDRPVGPRNGEECSVLGVPTSLTVEGLLTQSTDLQQQQQQQQDTPHDEGTTSEVCVDNSNSIDESTQHDDTNSDELQHVLQRLYPHKGVTHQKLQARHDEMLPSYLLQDADMDREREWLSVQSADLVWRSSDDMRRQRVNRRELELKRRQLQCDLEQERVRHLSEEITVQRSQKKQRGMCLPVQHTTTAAVLPSIHSTG